MKTVNEQIKLPVKLVYRASLGQEAIFDAAGELVAECPDRHQAHAIATALNGQGGLVKLAERLMSFAPSDDVLYNLGRGDGEPREFPFTCKLTDAEIKQFRSAIAAARGKG